MRKNTSSEFGVRSPGLKNKAATFKAISVIILTVLMGVLFSCGGKKEVKRPLAEVTTYNETLKVLERIKSAYIKKDREELKRFCTKDGYLTIIGGMKEFDSAELTFTPQWMDLETERVVLYINWEGTWLKDGRQFKEKGLGAFVFTGIPLRLDDVYRENPFRQPGY